MVFSDEILYDDKQTAINLHLPQPKELYRIDNIYINGIILWGSLRRLLSQSFPAFSTRGSTQGSSRAHENHEPYPCNSGRGRTNGLF
jgi:hypothetical protein